MTAFQNVFAGLLAALAVVTAVPAAGSASATDAEPATWSVRPGTADGQDGRAWVEKALAPGESASDFAVIHNFSAGDTEFRLTAADGYFTDTGRFNMLPSDQRSVDAGLWIDMPDTVTVPAGESVAIGFTVTVPPDAVPGDHPAGIAASIGTSGVDAGGSIVGVESRVGFRVMTRVTGELAPAVDVAAAAQFLPSWNPFSPGALTVDYEIRNTGNTRMSVTPLIRTEGPFGLSTADVEGEQIVEIEPGGVRTSTIEYRNIWPLFVQHVTVTTDAHAVADDLDIGRVVAADTHVSIPAPPWAQMGALILVAGVIVLALVERRRSRRRVEELIEKALADERSRVGAISVK